MNEKKLKIECQPSPGSTRPPPNDAVQGSVVHSRRSCALANSRKEPFTPWPVRMTSPGLTQ